MKEQKAANAAALAVQKEKDSLLEKRKAAEAGDASGDFGAGDTRARTKAFSDRLNRMSRKAVDDFVASMGLTDEATGEPVSTREQYEAYLAAHPQESKDVQNEETEALREEISRLRVQEQDAALLADPARGEAYRAVRDQVLALVEECRNAGYSEVDVGAAFAAVLRRECEKIFQHIEEQAETRAVRRLSDTARASVGKLGGGDTPVKPDYAAMSDEEFDRQLALARSGALRAK